MMLWHYCLFALKNFFIERKGKPRERNNYVSRDKTSFTELYYLNMPVTKKSAVLTNLQNEAINCSRDGKA